MKSLSKFTWLAIALCAAACSKSKVDNLIPDKDNGGITLPDKFGAVVVVDTIGRGRHLAINANGDIYLHLRRLTGDGKGIIALRDTSGDGRADIIEGYSNSTGTGIEIHNGYLYYADDRRVYRSKLTNGNLLPTGATDTLVTTVEGVGHMAKTFTFDNQGGLYVNIGSTSNCCEEILRMPHTPGDDPCVELETRAGIWRFDDSTPGQTQDLKYRYATGIRNALALTWNHEVNRLYAVQHGRDDLHRYWPEYYTEEQNAELPAEIFFDLEKGDDMGWPYYYYDHFQNKSLLNPEYGGDGVRTDGSEKSKAPLLGFPAHWAPNEILFYKGNLFPERYRHGAFIAFHGSWNRLGHEQKGFNVVFVPMKNGKPSGPYEIFADGFVGPEPIRNPAHAFFRPCGLAEGPDGSLYIADSQHGRIWRVVYYKNGIQKTADRVLYQPEVRQDESAPVVDEFAAGRSVYNTYCAPCHQRDGRGAPGMNPPLVGAATVTGASKELIAIALHGYARPATAGGERYQNVMPPFNYLTDRQIADVLTYIRKSWGNNADSVKLAEVVKARSTSTK